METTKENNRATNGTGKILQTLDAITNDWEIIKREWIDGELSQDRDNVIRLLKIALERVNDGKAAILRSYNVGSFEEYWGNRQEQVGETYEERRTRVTGM